MRKYLELFKENFPADIADKLVSSNCPYVGYSMTEDCVVYAAIPEPEEPDPAAGFVDLGLSVMWASCNLGASNPEELGETYKWGETDEHKRGEQEYTEKPYLSEHSYSYDRDAITVSMKDSPYVKYLHYRMPTAELWQELIDNTTREVYTNSEGRNICKYTSNINGNFILIPLLMEVNGNDCIYYKTSTPSSTSYFGSIIEIYNDTGGTYILSAQLDVSDHQNNYVRGVCSYPPKTDIIQYGNSISSDSTFVLTSAHSIEITCSEDFTVYFSNTPDFIPDSTDENVVGSYKAQKHGNRYDRQISCKELSFGQSRHDYLYVRFVINQSAQLTLSLWEVSSCVDKTVLITSGVPTALSSSSSKIVYRMLYADWKDYDFTAAWNKTTTLSAYVASYCDFVTTATDLLTTIVLNRRRPSYKVTSSVVGKWATSVQSDGFIFVRFVTTENGQATFTSSKPAEVDPTSSEAYSITPVATSATSSTDCGCETE